MNYDKLVKALRCKRDDCEGCDLAFLDNDEGWICQYAAKEDDAADAIERLIAERDEAKTDLAAVGRAFIREIEQHEPKREEVWKDVICHPSDCHMTHDISHAVHFEKRYGVYVEVQDVDEKGT